MGVFSILFGKYLLATNTISCGLMMAIGDILQQRSEHWKRRHDHKYFPEQSLSQTIVQFESSGIENIVLENVEETDLPYKHDFTRTRNMMAVGLIQGPFHHYFYIALDRYLPGRNTSSIFKKTFVDQAVASPTCLGIFFFGLGLLESRDIKDINEEVKLKFFDTWKVDCCFWPPTQFINFLLVPVKYRVIYINLMTMIYDIFLSYIKYDAAF
ncbi:mpv17-like protein 2 [Orussus abietinus]|uniref:mpv17-like protein 2 n=1 Tax=Orussus abietinus TaxID=222816 RepID=UPI000625F1DB|nr:mpv17-like protein 2 [Orussus abietinus]